MGKFGRQERVAYWRQVLAEQRASGLTVKAYCQLHKIAVPSFYQWRRKLQSGDETEVAAGFVPVRLVTNSSPGSKPVASQAERWPVGSADVRPECPARSGVQIITPSGFYLRVDSGASMDELAGWLRAIEGCGSQQAAYGQSAGAQANRFGQRGEAC
jgi:transposase-like protein